MSDEKATSGKGKRWVVFFAALLLLIVGLPLTAVIVSLTRNVDRIYGARVVRVPSPAGAPAASIDGWDESPMRMGPGPTVRAQRIRVGGIALEYRWSTRH